MKALVVDDSGSMRNIVKSSISKLGIFDEIYEAENGLEALKKLEEKGHIDLVLLDWYMPVMEGYDCLLQIRQNSNWEDIKVMMVTTENQQENIIRAVIAGANEYLMKPFTEEMIQEKVRMALSLYDE
jgi:two-component system chemotaxis response regulator CheY